VLNNQKNNELTLPFSLFTGKSTSSFQNKSVIIFKSKKQYSVQNDEFLFTNGTLQMRPLAMSQRLSGYSDYSQNTIPFASILALVLLIFFRNIYFSRFQKYFFSLVQNYEIDFSLQKIGFGPLILAVLIILFSMIGFFANPDIREVFFQNFIGPKFQIPVGLFLIPMVISSVLLFFLALSGKIFPLIFSDIKVFFGLSILFLLWNISAFGSDSEVFFPPSSFLLCVSGLFFLFRSFLFFQVFKRTYRFHLPLTLFYICTLNLGTFFFLFKVLEKDFF